MASAPGTDRASGCAGAASAHQIGGNTVSSGCAAAGTSRDSTGPGREAREQLAAEGVPLTRATVTCRAHALLAAQVIDTTSAPAC